MSENEKPAEKPKRNRPSRAEVPTGPIHRREMTKIRDEVGDIRDKLELEIRDLPHPEDRASLRKIHDQAAKLWITLDRLDLRFKIHHDPSAKKEG